MLKKTKEICPFDRTFRKEWREGKEERGGEKESENHFKF